MMRFGSVRHRILLAMFAGGLIDEGAAHHGGWYVLVLGVLTMVVALGVHSDQAHRPRPESLGDRILYYFGLR